MGELNKTFEVDSIFSMSKTHRQSIETLEDFHTEVNPHHKDSIGTCMSTPGFPKNPMSNSKQSILPLKNF